uniref:Reverse transcriptase n=1 Tax=Cannabis sativa TaxID=3483 RepID=A0A803Q763_CANSA
MSTPVEEGSIEELRLQFIEDATLELEADFEVNAEVAKSGVLAKLCGSRAIPKGRLKQILLGVWSLRGKWRMKMLEKGVWGFFFDSLEDKEEVLKRRPWIIAGQLLNIREWPKDGSWFNVPLNKAVFWVEIHGLPTPYLVFQNSRVIRAKVGEFLESDGVDNRTIARRGFLKLKVDIMIDQRLPAGFYLSITRGRKEWIQFKYRKLPKFCFNCGYLAHDRSERIKEKAFAYPLAGADGGYSGEDPHEKQGTNVCDEATISNTFGEGPDAAQVIEKPHFEVCKSRTPHHHPEPTFIKGPIQSVEELTEKMIGPLLVEGNELDSGTKWFHSNSVLTSSSKSKKRKAAGIVSPIIIFDSGKSVSPSKLKGLASEANNRDISPFSLGKNTPKKGSTGSRKLRNRKVTNDKSKSAVSKSHGNAEGIISARPAAIQALKAWVWKFRVDCVFLMETKIGVKHMSEICKSLQFENGRFIPSIGREGGVCLLWNKDVDIVIEKSLDFGLVCSVFDIAVAKSWNLIAIYGTPYDDHKNTFWDNMEVIVNSCRGPWALMGDLNVLLTREDKSGGRLSCLVMVLFYKSLCLLLGVLIWVSEGVGSLGSTNVLPAICWDVIKEAWTHSIPNEEAWCLGKKINRTQHALRWWSKNVFGKCDKRIKDLEDELQTLQSKEVRDSDPVSEEAILNNLSNLWRMKESMWKQRSRELWLSKRDRNTSFFHASTLVRRKRNHIWNLKNSSGLLVSNEKEIGFILRDYFINLFSSNENVSFEGLEDLISPSVSPLENNMLTAIPEKEEIYSHVFQMHPLKAPEPDGFSGCFYRKCWSLVGDDVVLCIQRFFTTGVLEPGLNHSFICLIPKGINPDSVDRFRPIALCNFVYKVIARIIAQRLRGVLDHFIAPIQSAFLLGRWIAESSLLTQEIMDVIKKKKGKGGLMATKMDMNKAYDRLEWGFLKIVMEKMGVINDLEKHLGNPFLFGRCKRKDFNFLKTKIWDRLEGWRVRSLSKAGRVVYINSVALAMPNYAMSTFKIPLTTCRDLDGVVRRFWWNRSPEHKRFWAAKSWDSLCQPKSVGGLGFRRFEDINHALLSKLAWQLASKIDRPWCKVFKSKYYPRQSFWSINEKNSDSFIWCGILSAQKTICDGACTIIASGEEVDVWWQPWIPWMEYEEFRALMKSVRSKAPSLCCVADLMYRRTRKWNLGYLCFLFGSELGNKISSIQIDRNGDSDTLIWKDSDVGRFSVKGAYWLDQKSRFGESSKLWKWIWYSKVHPRLSLMIWRAISGSLPTGDRIMAMENNTCPICHLAPETPVHLFCRCSFAVALWFSSPMPVRMDNIPANSLSEVIFNLIENLDSEGRNRMLCCTGIVIDCIWKFRNSLVHPPSVVPCLDNIRRDINIRFPELSNGELGDSALILPGLTNPKFPALRSDKCLMVDGSFLDGKYGCAMVALEQKSTHWWYGKSSGACDMSLEAELKAVIFGLQWATSKGWDNFTLLSDSKILVEAINLRKSPHWKLTALFSSLLLLLSSFSCCFVIFISRDYLTCVDVLAKAARLNVSSAQTFVGEGFPPVNLISIWPLI